MSSALVPLCHAKLAKMSDQLTIPDELNGMIFEMFRKQLKKFDSDNTTTEEIAEFVEELKKLQCDITDSEEKAIATIDDFLKESVEFFKTKDEPQLKNKGKKINQFLARVKKTYEKNKSDIEDIMIGKRVPRC